MATNYTNGQKQLLKEYGRLHRLHHSKIYQGNVKQEYERIKQELNRQKLTHKDYEEFERMEKYLKTANDLIREEKNKKAAESSGVIKIIIGVLLLFIGIGLSADTNYFFYGAIFSGIGLIISGGMDIYYK